MFSEKSIESGKGIFSAIMAARFVSDKEIEKTAADIIAKNTDDIKQAEEVAQQLKADIVKAVGENNFAKVAENSANLQALVIPPIVTQELAKELAMKKLGAQFDDIYTQFMTAMSMADSKVRATSSAAEKFDKWAVSSVWNGQTIVLAHYDVVNDANRQKYNLQAGEWAIRHGDSMRKVAAADATSPSKLTQSAKQLPSPQSKSFWNGAAELSADAVNIML